MNGPQPTLAQAIEALRVKRLLEAEGKAVCVHWNRCGCCISVHEVSDHPTEGYVIGSDGGSDWITA